MRRDGGADRLSTVENSRNCFGCGPENPAGLRLEFETLPDGRLRTRFRPRDEHGGWEGVFHGGLMATLLDEAMMAYLYRQGTSAATAELTVRYREPVRIGEELTVHAWKAGGKGRLLEMEAEALRDGKRVAWARARCLALPDRTAGTE